MKANIRDTSEYAAVAENLRKLHEPAFGLAHALREPHATADGSRVAVTRVVFDELAGVPTDRDLHLLGRRAAAGIGGVQLGALGEVRAGRVRTGVPVRSRQVRCVPALPALCERLGEAVAVQAVPGTIKYAHWSPDWRQLLLGVAGLGADLAGGQGSGTTPVEPDGEAPGWQTADAIGNGSSAW